MIKHREQWIKKIQDYKSSGLTAAEWCKKNNLSINSLRYHIWKLNKEKKEESQNTQWATVIPEKPEKTKIKAKPLKVIIGQSIIEVESNFDHDTFKNVVRIISEQC